MDVPNDTPAATDAQPAAASEIVQEQPAPTESITQMNYPPLPDPSLRGDVQGTNVAGYLRRRINEEQFDAFCVDCQDNRATHCVVTFGIFVCQQCAEKHEQTFSPFQSYVKALFEDAWDNFQINCVQAGGNKRFFEFMREYGKERDPIHKKYDSSPALFYRR